MSLMIKQHTPNNNNNQSNSNYPVSRSRATKEFRESLEFILDYRLFENRWLPLGAKDKPKAPFNPHRPGWKDYYPSKEEIIQLLKEEKATGVGIRTGKGVMALDIDNCLDIEPFRSMFEAALKGVGVIIQSPKQNSAKLLFRTQDSADEKLIQSLVGSRNKKIVKLAEGKQAEIFYGDTSQVAIFGKHSAQGNYIIKFGNLLSMPQLPSLTSNPFLTDWLVERTFDSSPVANRNREEPKSYSSDKADIELCRLLLSKYLNKPEYYDDHDKWVMVGFALKSEAEKEPDADKILFQFWDEW